MGSHHFERTEQTVSENKHKKAQEEKHSNVKYAVVGALSVVLVAFLLVWNTGIIQRNAAAVTVDGEKYSAADVQYYLRSLMLQNGISSTSSLKSMTMNSTTGETMYDYLKSQAVERLVTCAALDKQAAEEGFTMSDDTQTEVDDQLKQLEEQWVSAGYQSRDAFIRANYGPYMTYDRLVELFTRDMLVNEYATQFSDSLSYSDADYEQYYQENANTLDEYTITQFVFNATVDTTDADGNTIEMTDDEKSAALEQAKTEKQARAQELQSKLEAGEDPAQLAQEYADQLTGDPSVSQVMSGSSVASSSYAQWAQDTARQNGDVTLSEYDAGPSSYYYYVVRFEGRARNDENTATVRHILVAADQDEGASEPTEDQYAAAKTKAEELLDQWKSGAATEESFAELAKANSADTGSAADGGLITDIYSGSGYVSTFTDWALDAARQPGDTGIVQNTGSSVKGWHIMYFVGRDGDPVWKLTAKTAMENNDYTDWQNAAKDKVSYTTSFGLKFVQ